MENGKITAEKIISGFIDSRMVESGSKLFPNTYLDHWEADILELTKSDYLYEYEIKVSRADFKNDSKKKRRYWSGSEVTKYSELHNGNRVNNFSYIVPEGLIKPEEVPEFAGLIYAKESTIRYFSHERGYYDKPVVFFSTIKPAPRLSKEKATDKRKMKLFESCYYRFHKLRQNK